MFRWLYYIQIAAADGVLMILLYIFAEWLDRKPNAPLLLSSSPPLLTHVPLTRQKVRPFALLPFHTEPIFPPHTPINNAKRLPFTTKEPRYRLLNAARAPWCPSIQTPFSVAPPNPYTRQLLKSRTFPPPRLFVPRNPFTHYPFASCPRSFPVPVKSSMPFVGTCSLAFGWGVCKAMPKCVCVCVCVCTVGVCM